MASGNYVGNSLVEDLESSLAKYCGKKYAVAMNSGTDAITIALHLCGIKKKDEIITHANSFIATTASIVHLGAIPKFVDINYDQTIDHSLIQKKINNKTKGILVAHLNGKMNDMKQIKKIAKKNKLFLIEDCAQAIGSSIYGKKSGQWGDVGCFSTHPLKNFNACGDGGFIVTNNKSIYQKAKILINHGQESRGNYKFFAHVSRMDAIQAAILNFRLKTLNQVIRKRRENANLYFKELKKNEYVNFDIDNKKKKEFSTFHLFVIRCKHREKLIKYLKIKKIETGIHYPIPIHKQKAYKNFSNEMPYLKVTESISKQILSLPINEYLTRKQIIFICKKINQFYDKKIYKTVS